MLFQKKHKNPIQNKGTAVYMWHIKPDEPKKLPMKNIQKNAFYFEPKIIGAKEVENLALEMQCDRLFSLWKRIPTTWWIVKADLGRLIYVYLNGGFYFDVDCKVRKNFLEESKNKLTLFVERKLKSVKKLGPREDTSENRTLRIANYAFGSPNKKHPFLKKVIQECLDRLEIIFKEFKSAPPPKLQNSDVIWVCGPDVLTSMYHDFKHQFDDILLLDKSYLKHQCFGGWRF